MLDMKKKNLKNFQKFPNYFCFQGPESGIRIRIHIKMKPWIRIRIKAYADPKHWKSLRDSNVYFKQNVLP